MHSVDSSIVNTLIITKSLAYAWIYYEYVCKNSHKQMTIGCIIIWTYGHKSCKIKMSANKTERLCFWKFEKYTLKTILESEYMKKTNPQQTLGKSNS